MPILNYTTQIATEKTISEIQTILSSNGARSVITEYNDEGLAISVTFTIIFNGQLINYRLPASYHGVLRVLNKTKGITAKYKTDEQAVRVSWRIVKDWIRAQMALVEAEQAVIPEIFLPYAVTTSGKTLAQHFMDNGTKLLAQ